MRSPRRVLILAAALLVIHALILATIGVRSTGPVISEVIQLVLGLLTVYACVQAARRSIGFGRVFWKLASAGFAVLCVGQALGAYVGGLLNLPTQDLWFVDVFYTAWAAPLVMCLFLDTVGEQEGLDWRRVFDFGQVGIVFVLLYFFFWNVSKHGATRGSWWLSLVADDLITLGFFVRAASARREPAGVLFRRIGYFRLVAFLTDLYFVIGFPEPANASWFDLVWSIPFLIPIYAATEWRGDEPLAAGASPAIDQRRLLVTHVLPLIFPVLVLFMAAEVVRAQLIVAALAVLGSLFFSYARLIVTHREQRHSADALRQQHGLLKAIIEGTAESIFVKDLQTRYLMINPAGARFLGRSVEEVLGKDDREFFSEPTALQIIERDRRIMASGVTQTYEEQGTVSGVTRTFLSTKGPYRDAKGSVIGLVGSSVDITERNRAAEALAESEERFRTVFDGSPVGMAIIALDGKLIACNAACRDMLGIGPDEPMTTATFDEFTDPEHREADAARYQELVTGVIGQYRQEKHYLLRDGRTAWADLHVYLLRDRRGGPRYVIGMAIDITEQKLLESQLRQAQRMETIGTLAGGVAHDFNNLLTVIKGYSNLLMDRLGKDQDLGGQVQHIDRAAEQAASLTRQLLAFSRQQVLQPKVFNLNELVTNAEKLLRRLIGENIEMVTLTARDLGSVKADPSQIESVILNLVVNARDAMPAGGKITLETANVELDEAYGRQHIGATPGQYVMLAVSDTGLGMDAHTLAHIFEPFFTTKEVGKGTGLGLSTVYGIVKQSGGSIWPYSEPGKGTTFKVHLPRVGERAQTMIRRTATAAANHGSETILLVEDDPQVRDLTQEILERWGYRVLTAREPLDAPAMSLAYAGHIDLLLTDVMMPGLSGSELAAIVLEGRPRLKVLFMSGYTDTAVIRNGVLGSDAFFLQKPFTPSSLTQKIREILDQPPR